MHSPHLTYTETVALVYTRLGMPCCKACSDGGGDDDGDQQMLTNAETFRLAETWRGQLSIICCSKTDNIFAFACLLAGLLACHHLDAEGSSSASLLHRTTSCAPAGLGAGTPDASSQQQVPVN